MLKLLIIALLAASTAFSACSSSANAQDTSIVEVSENKFQKYKERVEQINADNMRIGNGCSLFIRDQSTDEMNEKFVVGVKIPGISNIKFVENGNKISMLEKACIGIAKDFTAPFIGKENRAENLCFEFVDIGGSAVFTLDRKDYMEDWKFGVNNKGISKFEDYQNCIDILNNAMESHGYYVSYNIWDESTESTETYLVQANVPIELTEYNIQYFTLFATYCNQCLEKAEELIDTKVENLRLEFVDTSGYVKSHVMVDRGVENHDLVEKDGWSTLKNVREELDDKRDELERYIELYTQIVEYQILLSGDSYYRGREIYISLSDADSVMILLRGADFQTLTANDITKLKLLMYGLSDYIEEHIPYKQSITYTAMSRDGKMITNMTKEIN